MRLKLFILKIAPRPLWGCIGHAFGWEWEPPASLSRRGHFHLNRPPYVIYEDEITGGLK